MGTGSKRTGSKKKKGKRCLPLVAGLGADDPSDSEEESLPAIDEVDENAPEHISEIHDADLSDEIEKSHDSQVKQQLRLPMNDCEPVPILEPLTELEPTTSGHPESLLTSSSTLPSSAHVDGDPEPMECGQPSGSEHRGDGDPDRLADSDPTFSPTGMPSHPNLPDSHPIGNPNFKGQWSKLFSDNREPTSDFLMKRIEKHSEDGCIDLSNEEELAQYIFGPNYCLVGYFFGKFPGTHAMKRLVDSRKPPKTAWVPKVPARDDEANEIATHEETTESIPLNSESLSPRINPHTTLVDIGDQPLHGQQPECSNLGDHPSSEDDCSTSPERALANAHYTLAIHQGSPNDDTVGLAEQILLDDQIPLAKQRGNTSVNEKGFQPVNRRRKQKSHGKRDTEHHQDRLRRAKHSQP
ncbi:hypothetical protein Dimus_028635 [Dionaea muscipula]